MLNTDAIIKNWEDCTIVQKEVNGKVICIQRFIFTYGILLDCEMYRYKARYCFEDLTNAIGFYNDYDGTQVPIIGKDGCTAIKGYI